MVRSPYTSSVNFQPLNCSLLLHGGGHTDCHAINSSLKVRCHDWLKSRHRLARAGISLSEWQRDDWESGSGPNATSGVPSGQRTSPRILEQCCPHDASYQSFGAGNGLARLWRAGRRRGWHLWWLTEGRWHWRARGHPAAGDMQV